MRAALLDRDEQSQAFRGNVVGVAPVALQDQLAAKLNVFLDLAASLELDHGEECAMLDLTMRDLLRLRSDTSQATGIGGAKLQRRLDYAIPVLRRMLASAAS